MTGMRRARGVKRRTEGRTPCRHVVSRKGRSEIARRSEELGKAVNDAARGAAQIAFDTRRPSPPEPEIIVKVLRQGLGEIFAP